MNRILDGKKVRFIAVDKKYERQPYPCIAPFDDQMSAYVTGQHIDPADEKTYENLTVEEMTGEADISIKKRKKFPHVINPENAVNIFHAKSYDCTLKPDGTPLKPKDYAEAYFILHQKWLTAINKQSVRPSKHKFYLDDKEENAKIRLLKADMRFEAEKLIREKATVDDYAIMLYMLNMRVPGFYEDPATLSPSTMMDILLTQAEENPKQITFYFTEEAEVHVFLAKLVGTKTVDKRHDGYFYKSTYLGLDDNAFATYLSDDNNSMIVDKLRKDIESISVT
jgi:hypothetical protein